MSPQERRTATIAVLVGGDPFAGVTSAARIAPVKIEHVAFQVADPRAVARWYCEHLGTTIKRAQSVPPYGHFLADSAGTVMLEFYSHASVPVPDYRAMNPMLLHVAFSARDIDAERARLIAAGAMPEGEAQTNPDGDRLAMLRDPWGLAIQLASRAAPMV